MSFKSPYTASKTLSTGYIVSREGRVTSMSHPESVKPSAFRVNDFQDVILMKGSTNERAAGASGLLQTLDKLGPDHPRCVALREALGWE
jgi:hypothetical protein